MFNKNKEIEKITIFVNVCVYIYIFYLFIYLFFPTLSIYKKYIMYKRCVKCIHPATRNIINPFYLRKIKF